MSHLYTDPTGPTVAYFGGWKIFKKQFFFNVDFTLAAEWRLVAFFAHHLNPDFDALEKMHR